MILQQIGWSYGHFRQMQSMQEAVQLTTFCVKSKLKNKCSFFKKKCRSGHIDGRILLRTYTYYSTYM